MAHIINFEEFYRNAKPTSQELSHGLENCLKTNKNLILHCVLNLFRDQLRYRAGQRPGIPAVSEVEILEIVELMPDCDSSYAVIYSSPYHMVRVMVVDPYHGGETGVFMKPRPIGEGISADLGDDEILVVAKALRKHGVRVETKREVKN